MSGPGPDADKAIQSRDGKKLLDEVIHLMDKNNKLGLVKLVENDENGENVKTLHFYPFPLRCCSPRCGRYAFHLRHSGSTATFIVGGADHSALLR